MCGICGTVGVSGGPERVRLLSEALARRGPDDCGFWAGDDVALGHRRLSIIGLTPTGRNPMWNETQDVALVFNGEIFNYAALRTELVSRGHRFISDTDSEVLVHLYEDLGEELCSRLDGMYAFAIWDAKRRTLFAARDPFGEKPFYYHHDGRQFAFASTVTALVRSDIVSPTIDPDEVASFLVLGGAVAPSTMLASVRALPAGSRLRFEPDTGRLTITADRTAWQMLESSTTTGSNLGWSDFVDAVARRMIADVPVGVFLSGGLDSTTVAAAMRAQVTGRLLSFSIGYERQHAAFDETNDAEAAARLLDTEHHVEVVTRDDFVSSLDEILAALDLPSHDGVNSYYASRLAARHVKVAMTGIGGDEMFGGYSTFRYELASRRRIGVIARAVGRLAGPVATKLAAWSEARGETRWPLLLLAQGSQGSHDTFSRWLQVRRLTPPESVGSLVPSARRFASGAWPSAVRSLLEISASEEASVSLLDCVGYMTPVLLRDADAASMHHGLELRVPFLDHVLVREAFKLPLEQLVGPAGGKDPLRDIVRGRVPPGVIAKPKQGFGMPIGDWLRDRRLRQVMSEAISDCGSIAKDVFDMRRVAAEFRSFHESKTVPPYRRVMRVWMLFSLLHWFRRLESAA